MEEKNKAWKTVSSKYLFRRPWLTVRCEDMLLPNGNHIPEYYILERSEESRVGKKCK